MFVPGLDGLVYYRSVQEGKPFISFCGVGVRQVHAAVCLSNFDAPQFCGFQAHNRDWGLTSVFGYRRHSGCLGTQASDPPPLQKEVGLTLKQFCISEAQTLSMDLDHSLLY